MPSTLQKSHRSASRHRNAWSKSQKSSDLFQRLVSALSTPNLSHEAQYLLHEDLEQIAGQSPTFKSRLALAIRAIRLTEAPGTTQSSRESSKNILTDSSQSASKPLKQKAAQTRRTAKRREERSVREVSVNLDLLDRLLSSDLSVSGDGPLTSDMSLETVERIMLRKSFLKKFEGAVNPRADAQSIADFLARNKACASWEFAADNLFDQEIDDQVHEIWHRFVYPSFDSTFGLAAISAGFSVGPGANVGCEEDDFLTKVFHSPLSSTQEDLHTFYTYAIRGSSWELAEKRRYAQYGLKIVSGSRLTTVPKTVDETRVIAVEPTLNMIFQKGIGQWIESGLRAAFGIDIRRGLPNQVTQPEINRLLAQRGSMLDSSESFCTIDLKGASDSMALRLCERHIPPVLLGWLKLARSPRISLPDGSEVELDMVGSMGNAFTFPLQTAMFASIVKACYLVMGIPTPRCDAKKPTFGVFGDDIIVRREAYNVVTRALVRYGFTVNESKSFGSGHFRESCGGDYWKGHLVRGVYVRKIRSQADVYSVINRLVRWSVRSGVRLDLTLMYLFSRIRRPMVVPFTEGDTGGVKVPKTLWLQEYYATSTRSPLYRALAEKPRTYSAPTEDQPWSVEGGHRRLYNGDAVLVSLLGGYIRTECGGRNMDGRVGLRSSKEQRQIVRWRSVPNWDFIPPAEALLLRGGDWVVSSAEILADLVRE